MGFPSQEARGPGPAKGAEVEGEQERAEKLGAGHWQVGTLCCLYFPVHHFFPG